MNRFERKADVRNWIAALLVLLFHTRAATGGCCGCGNGATCIMSSWFLCYCTFLYQESLVHYEVLFLTSINITWA